MLSQIVALAQRLPELRPHINTEEATKNALVMPFITALGYNVFDPTEVVPEFIADVGIKKGEKVDYAIKHAGKISLLIECKSSHTKLDEAKMGQLYRYFSVTKARIGILTNGVEYRFFSDLDEPNIMDSKPFFIFSLLEVRDDHLAEVEKLSKDKYDLETMLASAGNLKYMREIKQVLMQEFEQPSKELVKVVFNAVTPGARFTSDNLELFRELTKKAIANLIRERVSTRLRTALATEGDAHVEISQDTTPEIEDSEANIQDPKSDNGIETTEEEIEGYHIVRAIVRVAVDAKRVVHRDTKSYMGILLDNNNRRPICRLRFNYSTKYLGLLNQDKSEEKIVIDSLDDIYKYSDRLIATAQAYV